MGGKGVLSLVGREGWGGGGDEQYLKGQGGGNPRDRWR
jgi:hypothetical protein